jgi:hypothetical protein
MSRADGTPLEIVHRDISPANILIDQSGHVKLHDFGIARMADDEFKTQDGTFRGTLSYTAPETLQGIAATARSDLYACGVILYQVLTGVNPFRGEQPSETLHRVVTHVPPTVASLRDDVNPALDAAIARAMEKEPANRFDSAASFAAALRAARTWSEDEAALELARVIHEDFSSDEMPRLLSLETLQSRDAAWRAALPTRERTPLRSSRPPRGSMHETETASVPQQVGEATVRALPSHALLQQARASPAATPESEAVSAPSAAVPASAPTKRRPLLALVLGALVLALAGAAYPLLRKDAAPAPPRFLLIEKQVDGEADAKASASPATSTAAAPAASANATSPAAATKATHVVDVSKTSTSGSTLTSAFQRQRGRVEACFRASPNEDTPPLTLHFQVDASGAVRAAELAPASVAGSALGACILGVARATHFPTSDAAVSFSIPITARKTGG